MTVPAFDTDGVFGEDWVYFFAKLLDSNSNHEADFIWRLLELDPCMEVLDLGCGYGRIANQLAERGCRVTGLDTTSSFLDRARRDATTRGVTVTYVEGDMRELPWTERFDRVVSWFTSFGYFDDADNRRVLSEVVRAFKPGGRFMIEMINRDWMMRRFQHASVVERDGDRIVDRHRWEPLTGRLVTERTMIRNGHTRDVQFFVRMFTFTELRDWLLDAGFTKVDGYDEIGEQLGPESNRMIVVATR
ncbi:class I SAM-dependent methyltransferase [Actinomadura alba]|uniref:Class I SAM-dependent methyltransferase n=2 Tax=Actinomadura alba TaxID=406431 RepID=A0ABR7LRN0_9ACTN|nr:class I SAM-dependent methyltransferase [Actinomadura alba]